MVRRRISALGLVTFAVVVHAGCDAPTCPPGEHGPYDNRDRKNFPSVDQDWVCVAEPEPVTPPKPPDLAGYRPVDDTRFRDHTTTARAAIFLQSCDPGYFFKNFNVTDMIEATYGAIMNSVFEQTILAHSNCFQQKRNGCSAVQECLGIAFTPTNSAFTPGCNGSVAMSRLESSSGQIYDVWVDCGLNTQSLLYSTCYATPEPHCAAASYLCDPKMPPGRCEGNAPKNCAYPTGSNEYTTFMSYDCSNYALTCAVTGDTATCVGDGPACDPISSSNDAFFADFRAGLSCEDDKTLRACINGHEELVDCTSLGLEIKCIGGARPHCGADFQCNYEGTNPPPTCEGTLIHVCNAGVPMTFDCAELGFETCDTMRGACKPKPIDVEK